ncbi:MAG: TetR family transcriptional regulator [Tropicimonas sp.]|uniref:TetR family transcriptional regulator n=1 Tax=Tropicimonas sp. TaxID=2067044 RepID=UPI003A8B605D
MSGARPAEPRRRDAEASRRAILQAALEEFAEKGHDGARIDEIALRAGVSKPLIYDYFGNKNAVYAAALREAYVQIREGEEELELDAMAPAEAIRSLVRFSALHFQEKPWFITMLNTENLRRGSTITDLKDAGEIQSVLVRKLAAVLERGAAEGVFRSGVDPVELYISIASLCYFPVSNRFTLRVVFGCPVDRAWMERCAEAASEMLLLWLAPPQNTRKSR